MTDGHTVEDRLAAVEAGQGALRDEMRAGFARIDARFAEVPTREEMQLQLARMATREEMQAQGNDLRATLQKWHDESVAANVELREYFESVSGRHAADTRRYFDVVADGLRDDIRRVAEAQVAMNEKLGATQRRTRGNQ